MTFQSVTLSAAKCLFFARGRDPFVVLRAGLRLRCAPTTNDMRVVTLNAVKSLPAAKS